MFTTNRMFCLIDNQGKQKQGSMDRKIYRNLKSLNILRNSTCPEPWGGRVCCTDYFPLSVCQGCSLMQDVSFSYKAADNTLQPLLLKIHMASSQSCFMDWAVLSAASITPDSSQIPVTPVPRNLTPLSSLLRHLAHTWHTLRHAYITFKRKKNTHRGYFSEYVQCGARCL